MNPETKKTKKVLIKTGKLTRRTNCLLKFPVLSPDHIEEFFLIERTLNPVIKGLFNLYEDQYKILMWQYMKDYCQIDIANKLGRSPAYIKKRTSVLLGRLSKEIDAEDILNKISFFYPSKNKNKLKEDRDKLKSYDFKQTLRKAKLYHHNLKLKKKKQKTNYDTNILADKILDIKNDALLNYYNFIEYEKALSELSSEYREIVLAKNSRFNLSDKELTEHKFCLSSKIEINNRWYHSKKTTQTILEAQNPDLIHNKRSKAFDEMSKIVNFK